MEQWWVSIPWPKVLLPEPSWAEKIVRPILVYVILLGIFRVASKRELAQSTLFDFLIILLISNVVQNAIIGEDNSVLGAAAGAVTLVVLSGWLDWITARSRRARILLEGKPVLLVRDGQLDHAMLRKHSISRGDLCTAVRKGGVTRLADVGFAVLELDGSISIIRKDEDPRPHDCLPAELGGCAMEGDF